MQTRPRRTTARARLSTWSDSPLALETPNERPGEWLLDDAGGSCICPAPEDGSAPTLWYEVTVPAGVTAVEIDAVGSGAMLGAVERPAFGTRVRATVTACPGERLSIRTSGLLFADGGSEVAFASDWADRWVFASGGEHRSSSWGPVGAVIEERAHRGPGCVTLSWRRV